mmetsp:Transcript_132758/g.424748  ORF Transcript_132758/g.424748 Transcript_132758/m.424748 type:complete len:240 (-) Transcript_132758:1424-2143(-)
MSLGVCNQGLRTMHIQQIVVAPDVVLRPHLVSLGQTLCLLFERALVVDVLWCIGVDRQRDHSDHTLASAAPQLGNTLRSRPLWGLCRICPVHVQLQFKGLMSFFRLLPPNCQHQIRRAALDPDQHHADGSRGCEEGLGMQAQRGLRHQGRDHDRVIFQHVRIASLLKLCAERRLATLQYAPLLGGELQALQTSCDHNLQGPELRMVCYAQEEGLFFGEGSAQLPRAYAGFKCALRDLLL